MHISILKSNKHTHAYIYSILHIRAYGTYILAYYDNFIFILFFINIYIYFFSIIIIINIIIMILNERTLMIAFIFIFILSHFSQQPKTYICVYFSFFIYYLSLYSKLYLNVCVLQEKAAENSLCKFLISSIYYVRK